MNAQHRLSAGATGIMATPRRSAPRFATRLGPHLAVPVAVLVSAAVSAGRVRLDTAGLESSDPFTLSATSAARELTPTIAMREGWRRYARDVGSGTAVSVTVAKASCFAADGEHSIPNTVNGELKGTFKLVQRLRRTKPGGTLIAKFSLMTCDALTCLPPKDLTLSATKIGVGATGPLRVLAVTLDDAARSARSESFLGERGFTCTQGKDEGLTAKACERYDIVVADSPNADAEIARAVRKKRRLAAAFPRTRTPIIAVGYLGTALLAAHEIAMASGYI